MAAIVSANTLNLKRGLIATKLGHIHYVTTGQKESKTPILCFHMSPRSTDEYKEASALLSERGYYVVAVDMPGYGSSDNPTKTCSIDEVGDAFLEVADSLEIEQFVAAGSLLGNFVAISLAKRYPTRVKAVIFSNLYHWTQAQEEKEKQPEFSIDNQEFTDSWVVEEDGSHMTKIWNSRSGWLSPELNNRITLDAFNYHIKRRVRYAVNIGIQDSSKFDFLSYSKAIKCPSLIITGTACCKMFDGIGFNMTDQIEAAASELRITPVDIENGTINMINQSAEEWVDLVVGFLS